MIAELKQALEGAQRIALVCHVSPDMDTLGSAAALGLILAGRGKQAVVYAQDPVPERYLFLEPLRKVRQPDGETYDLCVSVDVSDAARMGTASAVFESAASRAMIDHHRTTQPFAPVHVIRPQAAATAQIVVELCNAYGWEIPRDAAMCLCAGLSTDTGNFSFDSVTGDTFRAAGACVDCGADTDCITRQLYRTSTEGHIRAMGRVLNGLELIAEGRVALMQVTRRDLDELHATQEDTEGIINLALEIQSVQTAALLSEREGFIKCSLRAKDPLDVAQVAAQFGGGGHIRAAGCSFTGMTIEQARGIIGKALTEIAQ